MPKSWSADQRRS